MDSQNDGHSKLAFTSRCVPGSPAEQEEKERLAAFQRTKSINQANEASNRGEQEAQRHRDFLANKIKMEKDRMHKQRMQNHYVPRTSSTDIPR